ncbi:hypothetical protein AAE02nite_18340 [Adhaeribacter aerolatus]|uniref:Phage tail protein n=1 Tax=Adhaeribacter aerolatus TaxID=670289 RepID=A0A512AWX9_9BACT|nr:type VI secretion system tube protein TssD [Adhaeribacter aerolatus]GEO04170.1 hypothetical protein AAE02nite_18340 [Adhaeribacter aerolatus]
MAVNARLNLDKIKDARVIDFSYNFNRDIDASGRPSGQVRGGTVNITIESTKSAFLPEWMTTQTGKTKSGEIIINSDENETQSVKKILFNDSFIVNYGESFSWQGGENMMETFTISAHEIKIEGEGTAQFKNEWPSKK